MIPTLAISPPVDAPSLIAQLPLASTLPTSKSLAPVTMTRLKTTTTATTTTTTTTKTKPAITSATCDNAVAGGGGGTDAHAAAAVPLLSPLDSLLQAIQAKRIRRIVVMTGAGISTASGIPDFRSVKTGLYANLHSYNVPYPEAIFETGYFRQNPRPFYLLAKDLLPNVDKYKPNKVHYFLRLLQEKQLLHRLYTQNIDGLHALSGIESSKLIEAHGSFRSAKCILCQSPYSGLYVKEEVMKERVPLCKAAKCRGVVKPDIVFFGESLPAQFYSMHERDFMLADLVLVMGTSLEVEPFCNIIKKARLHTPRLLLNKESVGPFKAIRFTAANTGRRRPDMQILDDLTRGVELLVDKLGWKHELDCLIEKELQMLNAQKNFILEKCYFVFPGARMQPEARARRHTSFALVRCNSSSSGSSSSSNSNGCRKKTSDAETKKSGFVFKLTAFKALDINDSTTSPPPSTGHRALGRNNSNNQNNKNCNTYFSFKPKGNGCSGAVERIGQPSRILSKRPTAKCKHDTDDNDDANDSEAGDDDDDDDDDYKAVKDHESNSNSNNSSQLSNYSTMFDSTTLSDLNNLRLTRINGSCSKLRSVAHLEGAVRLAESLQSQQNSNQDQVSLSSNKKFVYRNSLFTANSKPLQIRKVQTFASDFSAT